MPALPRFIVLVCLIFLPGTHVLGMASPKALKGKPNLAPLKEAQNYNECRKGAITSPKNGDDRQRAMLEKAAIAQCRDEYPAVAALIDCKKRALNTANGVTEALKLTLKACRADYALLAFNPTADVPFHLVGQEAYFAGVGLNTPRQMSKDNAKPKTFGNFSCDNLANAMTDKGQEDYILFGNEPKVFEPLGSLTDPKKLRKVLSLKPSPKKVAEVYFDSPFMGRFFPDQKKRLIGYFPSAFCHFDRMMGSRYEGIKIYYLLDRARMLATPFFAASFFAEGHAPELLDLESKVLAALGNTYHKAQNKKGVVFVSSGDLRETDSEGDPLNLCRKPREHKYVAVIKPVKKGSQADILILANVANLCAYGDNSAARAFKASL